MMNQELKNEIFSQLDVIMNGEPGDLAGAIQRLDALKAETNGHLSHYLQNRSYEKAWKLLRSEISGQGS